MNENKARTLCGGFLFAHARTPLTRLGSAGRGTNRDARSGVGKCLGLKVAGEESANSE
jgi:hypothetical protein